MNDLFDSLLVSSPNVGGLFFLHEGNAFKLDNFNTTGLSVNGRKVLRGVQPSALQLYDNGLFEITESTVPFDDIHDVYLDDQCVYLVGTSGNEVVKLDLAGEELQRWVLPGEEDSLHINCLALWNGRIVFSAFGEFTGHYSYKGKTEKSGFVQDLHTGQRLITGLSQPHSLVPVGRNLLLANSETKELSEYGPSGDLLRTLALEGYPRGICVTDNALYVGLSCSRNIECPGVGNATVVALNKDSWEELGRVHLPVAEVYSIQEIANRDDVIHVLATIASNSSSRLASAVAERDGQIAALHQAMAEYDGQKRHGFVQMDADIKGRDAKIRHLVELVDGKNRELALIHNSASWFITKPLRSIKHQIRCLLSLPWRVSSLLQNLNRARHTSHFTSEGPSKPDPNGYSESVQPSGNG
jgi:hypothetical protein